MPLLCCCQRGFCGSCFVGESEFWGWVEKTSSCWLWLGSRLPTGYGYFYRRGESRRLTYAHRHAFILTHGELPVGAVVRHSCDNPACVNPEHLSSGTQADNVRDMVARGRCNPARGERHRSAKLTEEQVRELRSYSAQGVKNCDLATWYRLDRSSVSRIVSRKKWAHIGVGG